MAPFIWFFIVLSRVFFFFLFFWKKLWKCPKYDIDQQTACKEPIHWTKYTIVDTVVFIAPKGGAMTNFSKLFMALATKTNNYFTRLFAEYFANFYYLGQTMKYKKWSKSWKLEAIAIRIQIWIDHARGKNVYRIRTSLLPDHKKYQAGYECQN